MRITVRTLLIYTGCVGLVLGQARLPVGVGIVCLMAEHVIVGLLLPMRLSLWQSFGLMLGIVLGLVVWGITERWGEINLMTLAPGDDYQALMQARMASMWFFLACSIQLGALLGGTLGLIIGEVRYRSRQRTLATTSLSA